MDLGERLLELTEKIKIGDFALMEDQAEPENYDIVFVEGTPITSQNVTRIKDLRARTKLLVCIGACACLGGIAELKNYQNKEQRLRYVYKNFEGIANPDIRPVKYYVKVDLEIPGCPINKEEFLWAVKELIAGIIPKIPQRPVCYECQLKRNECLLQKGQPCLGPAIAGGCGAPCPSSAYPCDGCRGPLKSAAINNFNNKLKEIYGFSQQEIDLIMQRFGMLDDMYPSPPIKMQNANIKIKNDNEKL